MSQAPRRINTQRSLNRPTEQRPTEAPLKGQPDFFQEEPSVPHVEQRTRPAAPASHGGNGGNGTPPRGGGPPAPPAPPPPPPPPPPKAIQQPLATMPPSIAPTPTAESTPAA